MAYQQPLIMQADHVNTDISYNTSATGLKPGHVALSALQNLIQRLPKAELHLHIEGTLEVDMLFQLARRNGVQLPYADEAAARAARSNFTCLEDFIDLFTDVNVLRTERDFYELAAAYLRRAAAENVKHVEMQFDPQGHMIRGIPFATVYNGLSRAIQESPVDASLIFAFERSRSQLSAAKALMQAVPHLSGICAVGLAGPEVGNPPSNFKEVFGSARLLRLHKVAHAGEEGGPSYVREALSLLGAERIDHGIRSLEDPALVAAMVKSQVPITLCPLSNVRLQVYKGQLEDRIRQVLASGMRVTINSDDPAYFGSYVSGNYEWVAGIAGLGPDDLASLAANSFTSSFMPQVV
ncbi:adenosine deaminase [Monoraphidium neglectum]|uniref:Adenosine deaminase n=1 Tax=Monoraphidium neglectum TaxID=145388 RepID=A0A0D2LMH8_9CHLO|nr:adenosine deaminase [Monoraphidium neglectum]KIZ07529.1 adenosine deaminase [Monoraphidium neglectum]|eukprot:XP_013906548.1 adenosine deaminase [Monoraphidium neglectum]